MTPSAAANRVGLPQAPSSELKKKAESFHAQGYTARKNGDFQAAISLYSKALEIYPHHFKALFNRGFAFDKLG